MILLDEVIRQYIKKQEPIGSETLRVVLGVKISSATIRNYFKLLNDEGVLMQPHISSGRIPTKIALKNYWLSHISIDDLCKKVDKNKLLDACHKFKIASVVMIHEPQKLLEVLNLQDRFLALVFEHDQTIIPFNEKVEKFINELVGLELEDIKKIASDVHASSVSTALKRLGGSFRLHNFGIAYLHELLKNHESLFFDIVEGTIFSCTSNGVSFPKVGDHMFVIHDTTMDDLNARMLCVGTLDCDYENFYDRIA